MEAGRGGSSLRGPCEEGRNPETKKKTEGCFLNIQDRKKSAKEGYQA